jgi:hypothetical protein
LKDQHHAPTEALSFESPYFDQFKDMLLTRIYNCRYNPLKCDHTLKETIFVLRFLYLDVDKSIEFLEEHGGFCDCEVIYNVRKN